MSSKPYCYFDERMGVDLDTMIGDRENRLKWAEAAARRVLKQIIEEDNSINAGTVKTVEDGVVVTLSFKIEVD